MNYLSWLTVSTTILLTAAPSFAASQQITGVDLENKKQGLELKLELNNNDNFVSSFVTVDGGKTLETTILNTKLGLTQKEVFQQSNPAPGISKITLDRVDKEHTKITLIKDSSLALEPVIEQQDSEIVVSFNLEKEDNSLLHKFPFSSNITSFKNSIASLVTNKNTKDEDKVTNKVTDNNQNNDVLVPNPEIIISNQSDGLNSNLQSENSYDQPYLPRAVAPPVGDMAVSNISTFPDTVDLGSSAVVPRLVLRDAPVREVLSLLARQAGLNIVFAIDEEEQGGDDENAVEGPIVSLDLENQTVQEVFDSILLISDLTASRRGNIIYIGEKLPAQARNLISRTIRLNQVRAENAALFLASQGGQGQRLTTEVEETVDPETGRVVQRKELPATLEDLGGAADDEENSTSALLLRGLQVSTDDRMNSITLVGEPRKVEMATAFLTQLDARRRQVAVNIKVIDVNLLNQDVFNSSFSFGIGDTFYTQDNGSAVLNFGDTRPPSESQVNSSQFSPAVVPFNVPGAELEPFFDIQEAPYGGIDTGSNEFVNGTSPYARPNFGTLDNPFQPGIIDVSPNIEDNTVEYEYSLPGLFEFPKRFLAQLEARITSGNAKILTDPTVVVQEGQESTVKLTQDIIKGIDSNISDNGVTTNTPIYDEAGLTVTVNVERIDDNGFIALSVSPTVSSIASQQEFDSGNAINLISLLSRREVSSGLIRLRDSQTLILSGIIQDQERVAVTKVPILGDIPLLGSLFRSTNKTNERAEVIVLLTPEIIDEQADFGYNYQPSKDTREMLRKGGLNLPNNPE
ncbi:Type II and III secretion system protein [Hyella patelloides LEGE 07179]|uniref:Type II and III secretion system protein n=1 Tax=Hyella patelloides LEGE 07179 TaxID=945734 RepID=A0A563VIV9_9CYAN|nr:secretin N-terminal domain-containing protein [Hyella patelloides]VEP11370.1 Type II and III secretion system protein [Hyella patelloides LEGE 07179]